MPHPATPTDEAQLLGEYVGPDGISVCVFALPRWAYPLAELDATPGTGSPHTGGPMEARWPN